MQGTGIGKPITGAGGLGGFNLGGGLQLGGQQSTATSTGSGLGAGGFKLGGGGLQLGQGGLQLGQQSTGATPLATGQTGVTIGLGRPLAQTSTAGGLQLGQIGGLNSGGPKLPSYSTATLPGAAQSGLTTQTTKAQTSLQLGGLATSTTKPGGGLQLGGLATNPGAGLQQLGGLATSTTKPGAGLKLEGGLTQTPLTQTAKGPTTTGGLQLGAQKLGGGTSQLSGLSTTVTKAQTTTGAPTLGGLTTAQSKLGFQNTISLGGGLKTGGGLSTTTTLATTGAPTLAKATKKYTYKELEGLVNKWTLELQNQEKLFLQQAQQVNKWDRSLAENGDKIVELNSEVDRVKNEQKRVNNELDVIEGQQIELEQLLSQLESRVDSIPTQASLHADMQRTRTFQMAGNIDSQLKQMSKDLKMIIEQMNESNTSNDEENPFTQIVRILNAHTDSLGWIDHEAALLRKKVDDVAKVTDYHRQEQELSFRNLAFSH